MKASENVPNVVNFENCLYQMRQGKPRPAESFAVIPIEGGTACVVSSAGRWVTEAPSIDLAPPV